MPNKVIAPMGGRWVVAGFLLLAVGVAPLRAEEAEQTAGRASGAAEVEHGFGRVKVHGSGDLSGDAQELSVGLQARRLFNGPLFFAGEGRVGQERLLPYDLHHWGGEVGLGAALDEATDLSAFYRLDDYSVFNVSADADAAFRTVRGLSTVSALGLALKRDQRDDPFYPTAGYRARLKGEMALRGWGGDYNFGRLESDFSLYATPLGSPAAGRWWGELTFVEHLRVGWLESFGSTDEVPFFERYFVGGASTVRGHRGRWLTPRGNDDQFVGGKLELLNNVEARLPIFKERFHRRLSVAAFFDVGRAYRRFSEVGDFGYGVGAGLRYVVKIWEVQGVARADYGVNLAREDDDSTSHLHLTFGIPF
ncbi:MAG: BamA/TamA family outer membrane protein [Candidatus Omnitrophica bacterium]|nr:BamA/TamA family outer membrane protein [Candidatus Omnitrophota bacterium]